MLCSIPLLFNDRAYHAPIDREYLCLPYTVIPSGKTQQRFRDRFVAEPKINLKEYEFRAVFDWIEISVETRKDHVGSNLQRQLMKLNKDFGAFRTCFVASPTKGTGHFGRSHIIKMQDPTPGGISGLLRVFLRDYCVPRYAFDEIPVTGLELSLDVYPANRFCEDEASYAIRRMLMTEMLRKHVAIDEVYRVGRRRPRFTHQDGTNKKTQYWVKPRGAAMYALRKTARETGMAYLDVASCDPAHHHQPLGDSTMYFGARGERLYYRLMDKISDNRRGDVADMLPLKTSRSRVEFTFIDETPGDERGPASVGIRSIEDLVLGSMTSFNTLLAFELPTFCRDKIDPKTPDQKAWDIFVKTGVGGLSQRNEAVDVIEGNKTALRAKRRQEILSSGNLLRFSAANMRVTRALRRLQERWRRDWC